MRRLVIVLALAATACTRGGSPQSTAAPTTAPTTTPAPSTSPAPAPPTGGLVRGYLTYATDDGVHVARGTATRRLASPGPVLDLGVSEDGRYVAYVVDAPELTVGVHDVVDGGSRTWAAAPDAGLVGSSIDATSAGFVVVSEGEDNRLLRFDPKTILGGGGPAFTALRGVSSARLVAARGDRVLVATAENSGPRGGPETVHDVAPDGSTTRLFQDGDGLPRGSRTLAIGHAGLSADGDTLVYGAGRAGEDCDLDLTVAVRDLSAGREVATKAPSLGRDVITAVHSVTVGGDGRMTVGFTTELGGCSQEPAAATYLLHGSAWTPMANGAEWAAPSPGGQLAVLAHDGTLTVDRRRVAAGVSLAAWSPV